MMNIEHNTVTGQIVNRVMTSFEQRQDFSKLTRAMNLAKIALGDDAILSEIVDRAKQIKETL